MTLDLWIKNCFYPFWVLNIQGYLVHTLPADDQALSVARTLARYWCEMGCCCWHWEWTSVTCNVLLIYIYIYIYAKTYLMFRQCKLGGKYIAMYPHNNSTCQYLLSGAMWLCAFCSTLVHAMAHGLFGAKPLPEPMLTYGLLGPRYKIQSNLNEPLYLEMYWNMSSAYQLLFCSGLNVWIFHLKWSTLSMFRCVESMGPGSSICNVQNKVLLYYRIWLYCGIRKNHFPLCRICRTTIVKISIFKTWTTIQEANAQSKSSNTTRTISCKAGTPL